MAQFVPRVLVSVATLALLASPVVAQRLALSGERASVAEAVDAWAAQASRRSPVVEVPDRQS